MLGFTASHSCDIVVSLGFTASHSCDIVVSVRVQKEFRWVGLLGYCVCLLVSLCVCNCIFKGHLEKSSMKTTLSPKTIQQVQRYDTILTKAGAVTYNKADTPTVTNIDPSDAGTGGGKTVSIRVMF